MPQGQWGGDTTKGRSQGGLNIPCDGNWKAHTFQNDDGQAQTSVFWVRRLLPPPSPLPPSHPSPSSPVASSGPLRDGDGGWRVCDFGASLCSSVSFRFMIFPHGQLRSPFSSSKPYTGFLRNLSPPLQFDGNVRGNLL